MNRRTKDVRTKNPMDPMPSPEEIDQKGKVHSRDQQQELGIPFDKDRHQPLRSRKAEQAPVVQESVC